MLPKPISDSELTETFSSLSIKDLFFIYTAHTHTHTDSQMHRYKENTIYTRLLRIMKQYLTKKANTYPETHTHLNLSHTDSKQGG